MSCLNCKDRVIGCHATCEKYAKFKERGDQIKKARLEELKRNQSSDKHIKNMINKLKRKK